MAGMDALAEDTKLVADAISTGVGILLVFNKRAFAKTTAQNE